MAKSRPSGAVAVQGEVSLQGIGKTPAIKAGSIKKGMTLKWNFGYTSKVLSVTPSKSGKSVEIETQGFDQFGRKTSVGKRTLRADRLVGVKK